MPSDTRSRRTASYTVAVLLLATIVPVHGQEPRRPQNADAAWTYDEARTQLQLYPRDVFLQYVALKLGQREGIDASESVGFRNQTRRETAFERREGVDLFNLFSGAVAVQESLQLDAMRPSANSAGRVDAAKIDSTVRIQELRGPTVKSHPWQEMLEGRSPEFSPLANYVPADNYYIRFRSVSRMLDIIDGGDLFAKHLYNQAGAHAFVRDTQTMLRRQLAVETNPLARPFYDLVVKELVITGGDPFVNEGSDVTLLFRFRQEAVFRTQMDAYLSAAEGEREDVTRIEENFQGIPFVHLTSSDRGVHVFSAYPEDGLHVRSNSRTAFERVLRLIKGPANADLPSLGQTKEFAYIRTLMPFEAPEEDGLIYLSDPFIRRLVGPELKLTELRRLLCLNNLRMIGHAAALYQAEQGRAPQTMDQLRTTDCLPDGFGEGGLTCACGGTYELSPDGRHASCSHHGHADALIPCCEIPETKVSQTEAKAYQQFVTEYSEYWRTFFDPIAIKVQATPERYRLETIVLPLIDNSMYQSLASSLGGEPKSLSANTTDDAVMSLSFAIDKKRLLQQSGWVPPEPTVAESPDAAAKSEALLASRNNMKQIMLGMHNYHDGHVSFPPAAGTQQLVPQHLSWRVHLLPYLGSAALYEEFHLDEPWDSTHNKRLISKMPAVFRSPGAKLAKPGTTTYLSVVGENTLFRKDGSGVRIREITDGTSNTAMLIDASPEFAEIWTKPGGLELDPARVRKALQERFGTGGLVALADGSVQELSRDVDDATISNLFTRNDGRVLPEDTFVARQITRRRNPFGLETVMEGRLTERDLYDLLVNGLGDTVGLHICDADPTFDIQLTELLTELFAGPGNRSGSIVSTEALMIGLAVSSLTSPVYVDVAVQDAEIVDRFLQTLDEGAALEARKPTDLGWFAFRKDFYVVEIGDTKVRSFVLSLGPVKWRFFFSRIGSHVSVASKLQTLEKLIAQTDDHSENQPAAHPSAADTRAHAQLTIHREQWKRILTSVRLAWDEGARHACLDNIGPLTSTARVIAGPGRNHGDRAISSMELMNAATKIYGGIHFCPCGGHYTTDEHGRVICSVHGDADHPKQPGPNADNGASLKVLNAFREIQVRLTFLEDGLHAVLEIERPGVGVGGH